MRLKRNSFQVIPKPVDPGGDLRVAVMGGDVTDVESGVRVSVSTINSLVIGAKTWIWLELTRDTDGLLDTATLNAAASFTQAADLILVAVVTHDTISQHVGGDVYLFPKRLETCRSVELNALTGEGETDYGKIQLKTDLTDAEIAAVAAVEDNGGGGMLYGVVTGTPATRKYRLCRSGIKVNGDNLELVLGNGLKWTSTTDRPIPFEVVGTAPVYVDAGSGAGVHLHISDADYALTLAFQVSASGITCSYYPPKLGVNVNGNLELQQGTQVTGVAVITFGEDFACPGGS